MYEIACSQRVVFQPTEVKIKKDIIINDNLIGMCSIAADLLLKIIDGYMEGPESVTMKERSLSQAPMRRGI